MTLTTTAEFAERVAGPFAFRRRFEIVALMAGCIKSERVVPEIEEVAP